MAKKSEVNINDLSTWPMALTLVFSIAIVAGIFYLIKMFLVDDITTEISSTESEIAKEEAQYTQNQQIIAMLPYIKKEVAELEKAREGLKKFLPTEVSMPDLIDNVYSVARNNSIVFNQQTPEADIETKHYIIKPISLSADVGYVSMSSFIEEVTTLKRIMNIDSVSFQAQGDEALHHKNANATLTMTAQLRTYILKDTPGAQGSK